MRERARSISEVAAEHPIVRPEDARLAELAAKNNLNATESAEALRLMLRREQQRARLAKRGPKR